MTLLEFGSAEWVRFNFDVLEDFGDVSPDCCVFSPYT
jgi:hypothetical protein